MLVLAGRHAPPLAAEKFRQRFRGAVGLMSQSLSCPYQHSKEKIRSSEMPETRNPKRVATEPTGASPGEGIETWDGGG